MCVVYLRGIDSSVESGAGFKKPRIPYSKVREYKQDMAIKMELNQEKVEFLKDKNQGSLAPRPLKKKVESLSLQQEEDTLREHFQDPPQNNFTLDQEMDLFLAQKQYHENRLEHRKEEYKAAFKERARAMGYEVKIDENMQIIDVKKIDPSP